MNKQINRRSQYTVDIFKCQLDGCCNFFMSLGLAKKYCRNHMESDGRLLYQFRNNHLSSTIRISKEEYAILLEIAQN